MDKMAKGTTNLAEWNVYIAISCSQNGAILGLIYETNKIIMLESVITKTLCLHSIKFTANAFNKLIHKA